MPKKKTTEDELEPQKPEKKLILLNSRETYGFTYNGKQYTLWQRKYYPERTEVFNPSDPQNYKVYEANSYGPWQLASLPYPTTRERLMQILLEYCNYDETLALDKPMFEDYIGMLEAAKAEVLAAVQKLHKA